MPPHAADCQIGFSGGTRGTNRLIHRYLVPDTFCHRFEPLDRPHAYLCNERGIPFGIVQSRRLSGRIRHCPRYGSIVFPHWGSTGAAGGTERCLTGYEIKGRGVNMFSKGGRKGLWMSAGFKHDRILAFAESGLDAVSYLAVTGVGDLRVCSLSGQMNPHQPALTRSAIERMGQGSEIVAAFDNDEAGDRLTENLLQLVKEIGRPDLAFREDRPQARGADWNQVVMKGLDREWELAVCGPSMSR